MVLDGLMQSVFGLLTEFLAGTFFDLIAGLLGGVIG